MNAIQKTRERLSRVNDLENASLLAREIETALKELEKEHDELLQKARDFAFYQWFHSSTKNATDTAEKFLVETGGIPNY